MLHIQRHRYRRDQKAEGLQKVENVRQMHIIPVKAVPMPHEPLEVGMHDVGEVLEYDRVSGQY